MGFTHRLGIDVVTRDVEKMISRLAPLKATVSVTNGGTYRADPNYSQVLLRTNMSEDQLCDWLYSTNHGCEYIGVFEQPSTVETESGDV